VLFLLVVFQNPLQNYCFFFIPTRRHAKVAYLPKSRNSVNTGQTPLQKNALFLFLFFYSKKFGYCFFIYGHEVRTNKAKVENRLKFKKIILKLAYLKKKQYLCSRF